MSDYKKSTHEMPGGEAEPAMDDGMVNDSLGTVDPADSTGTDEDNRDRRREEEQHTDDGNTERSGKPDEPGIGNTAERMTLIPFSVVLSCYQRRTPWPRFLSAISTTG